MKKVIKTENQVKMAIKTESEVKAEGKTSNISDRMTKTRCRTLQTSPATRCGLLGMVIYLIISVAVFLSMSVFLAGCGGAPMVDVTTSPNSSSAERQRDDSNAAPATTVAGNSRSSGSSDGDTGADISRASGSPTSVAAARAATEAADEWSDEWFADAAPVVPYQADYDIDNELSSNWMGDEAEAPLENSLEIRKYNTNEEDLAVDRYRETNNERYIEIVENNEIPVSRQSMFTFSMKVDTASYTNVQRYIENGSLPPLDAVKIEEMVNYFSYDNEPEFSAYDPFAISSEIGPSPFSADKYMAFVRVKARDIDIEQLPPSNLTFLIDSSGSMSSFDKLPLLKTSFGLLVDTLTEDDTVSIVTYAGTSKVVLDSVSGADKKRILDAINKLQAGGSTAGGEGIETAYRLAEKNFRQNGNNRIILATDGDFNVGVSSMSGLEALITQKRDSGIYLSILGFGMGNLRDDTMETLAKHGNGNASYINSVAAAKKVLVDELASNLYVIAEDVKAQIELNPDNIRSYRLIGYENRALDNRDFNDDTKDAGEIGVGSDVVVLFEFELNNANNGNNSGLKYSGSSREDPKSDDWDLSQLNSGFPNELFEVRLRYKKPGEAESRLILHPVGVERLVMRNNSDDFRFATAVVSFGHLLRRSSYLGNVTIDGIISVAQNSLGRDTQGYRYEFVKLLKEYKRIY